ncbi:hypothetical protein MT340_009160 [Staphylococcus sp. NRL 16/872]|uniref:hypothetical protein n=1 Tax=Staphylococcus sp. NRL 16/872 TaxID=2930131 RepID=UPI001FB47A28|nr:MULTISPECIES: hypothetical protein [unclassified Staphylococcus]MCJ1656709.1 hypothetical protein [Staphylococcus sp. NRL 21/187]MCJ1662461.1 hypothetical protein [Staphylococcus sp. NRL 18/288]MCJ1668557.1 hypothetical protein [Staphylococcus sp. NRL 19/737]WEN68774.1 hypothetical protein MT340_009160 [Staphylococcus sp. NRL 16/872]
MGSGISYEYVVYKGDDVICAGTAKECCEKLGISIGGFFAISSKHAYEIEKQTRDRLIAIRVPVKEIVGVGE